MESVSHIGFVLLAAGSSSRLGKPKQLLTHHSGVSMVRHAALQILDFHNSPKIIVTGAHSDEIQKEIVDLAIPMTYNAHYSSGISGSIKIGLQSILDTDQHLQAVVFLLADQPYLSSDNLRNLTDVYVQQKGSIIYSDYGQGWGSPVLFDRIWFEDIFSLAGDKGALSIVNKNISHATNIFFERGEVDLDTEAAYLDYLAKQ